MTKEQDINSLGCGQYEFPPAAVRELRDGLIVLLRAFSYAQDAGADRWEFAVEIQQFYDLGLSNNELRWLVAKGLAVHGRETSSCGDARRSFEPTAGLTFSKTSALVLSESGAALAADVFAALQEVDKTDDQANPPASPRSSQPPPARKDSPHQAAIKPTWDARRRELRIDGQLVKWFRVPAASQEAVLSAFEEESWPPYIDDPLPGVVDGCAQTTIAQRDQAS